MLYFAIEIEAFEHLLEGEGGLRGALLEGGEIIAILAQGLADGIVDELGDVGCGLGSLELESPVELGIEIHSGALGFVGEGHEKI
jgi:hypothetical protein